MNVAKKILAKYIYPQTNAVYLIRKMQYLHSKGKKIRRLLLHIKLQRRYGISYSGMSCIGEGLKLPHPTGIVIGNVAIGCNVTIYQNVTIGSRNIGDYKEKKQPQIGNDCVFFAGAKIIGEITVADNTVVGANSVLNKNSIGGVYAGVPASKIK